MDQAIRSQNIAEYVEMNDLLLINHINRNHGILNIFLKIFGLAIPNWFGRIAAKANLFKKFLADIRKMTFVTLEKTRDVTAIE